MFKITRTDDTVTATYDERWASGLDLIDMFRTEYPPDPAELEKAESISQQLADEAQAAMADLLHALTEINQGAVPALYEAIRRFIRDREEQRANAPAPDPTKYPSSSDG